MGLSGNIALALAKSYTRQTAEGMGAVKGQDGFSPIVRESADNTGEVYKLNIQTATGYITTPNLKGKDGKDGTDGTNGINGITPHIDTATKHWFIGDTDTGVTAVGKDGAQGIQGQQGEPGLQGIQGIQGIPGEKGDAGYPFLIYKEYDNLSEFQASDFPQIGLLFMVNTGENERPVYRVTGETEQPYSFVTNLSGAEGIKGDKGEQGEPGIQGVRGESGKDGTTYTPSIGTVTTLEPNANASANVTIDEETKTADFDFGIPRGAEGRNGISPSVEVKENTDESYVLTITDAKGTFDTPNLKGSYGGIGGSVAIINITTKTESFHGKTVTLTGQYETIESTFSAQGTTQFRAKYIGEYIISCEGYNRKITVNAIGEVYSVGINSATIYAFHLTGSSESDPDLKITYPAGSENENFTSAKMNYDTGVFDWGSWKDTWISKCFRPCMLKYDGTVDYYLDHNDYAKKEDGTPSDIANTSYGGNAMIEWGQNGKIIWYKIVPNDGSDEDMTVYIADEKPDDDYMAWSFINNQGNLVDHFYTPIYNGSLVDGKLRSLSGKAPITNNKRQQEIDYAKANNIEANVLWHTEVYADRTLINLLLLLIGKSTDMQTVFGTGNNNSYTSSSNTGIKASGTMNDKGLFWGNQDNVSGVKVFGMEHWWGNIWRALAGWVNANGSQKVKMTYGTEDSSTANGYNIDGNGYIASGKLAPLATNGGYIRKMVFAGNGLIPTVVGGSATTYFCDYLWGNNGQNNYAVVGGASNNELRDGAFCSSLYNKASDATWYIGASISCKPLA